VVENKAREVLLPVERADELAGMYLAERDPLDPFAAPLFADFTGAPRYGAQVAIRKFLETIRRDWPRLCALKGERSPW